MVRSAPRSPTLGFVHRCRRGVDAEHERPWLGARPRNHGPAVTGPEIGDHPVRPGDQVFDLADVDVDDAPADDLLHGPQSTLGP